MHLLNFMLTIMYQKELNPLQQSMIFINLVSLNILMFSQSLVWRKLQKVWLTTLQKYQILKNCKFN